MIKYIFLWLIILAFNTNAFSGEMITNYHSNQSILKKDAGHFFQTGVRLAKSSLNLHHGWKKKALVIGTTALLFTIDKKVRRIALANQSPLNDRIFNADHFYGSIYTAGLVVGSYGLGYFIKNEKIRRTGLYSVEAFVYSGIISGIFKIGIGRRRPYGGENMLVFKPFRMQKLYKALPSGHTTIAFAVSTVMANSVNNRFWKVFWFGSAGMVAASRIYHNVHWVSDVFLGGVIGNSIAKFVVNSDKKSGMHADYIINPNGITIRVSFN